MPKKNITQAEIDSAKKEHEASKAKRNKIFARGFNFIMACGMFAITAFLSILNAQPELGHYILSGFAGVAGLYFTIKTIWE